MKLEEVEKIVNGLKGKKAKKKSIDVDISGTKGVPLDKGLKGSLEEALGAKLNGVRVHTGGNADEVCKKLRVNAFTHGNDIFFGKPSNAKNKKMLAHELTHVIQQTGRMPRPVKGKVLTSK